ncbi:MAG TPA: hypothetical protein VNX25_04545 [Verrucomicrobiae bacterium]|nr:hypothetical protein [Verrucomicrobiae bacterium]
MVPGAESAAMDVELKGIRNRWFVEMDTDGRSYPAADTAKEKEAAINRMLDEQISAQLQKR